MSRKDFITYDTRQTRRATQHKNGNMQWTKAATILYLTYDQNGGEFQQYIRGISTAVTKRQGNGVISRRTGDHCQHWRWAGKHCPYDRQTGDGGS